MSLVLSPTEGITFPDGTKQDTAGISNKEPVFSVAPSIGQSTTGSLVKVIFGTVLIDNTSSWNSVLNRFEAPEHGFYLLAANIRGYADSGNTSTQLRVRKNGTIDLFTSSLDHPAANGSFHHVTATSVVELLVGDYVETWGSVNGTGSAFSVTSQGISSNFSGFLIRSLP